MFLAKTISILLGPHLWAPLLVLTLVTRTGLTNGQIKILFPSLFFFEFVAPLVYLFFALRLKKITAWDLPKRQERYPFLLVYFVLTLVSMILIQRYGNPFLFQLSLILLFLLVAILMVTFFFKISLHTSLVTLSTLMINFLYGWQLPYLFLVIPLVVWARLKLKRHTLAETLAAFIVVLVLTMISLNLMQPTNQ